MAYLLHFGRLIENSQWKRWLFGPNDPNQTKLIRIASEIIGNFVATTHF